MSDILLNDPATLYELSKRIDSLESEIKGIRERLHSSANEQNGIMGTIQEIDNNITNIYDKISKIYENQKNVNEKFSELEKSYDLRIEKVEETNLKMKMIFSNWKPLLIFGVFFILIGIGLDDIIKVALPDRVISHVQSK